MGRPNAQPGCAQLSGGNALDQPTTSHSWEEIERQRVDFSGYMKRK